MTAPLNSRRNVKLQTLALSKETITNLSAEEAKFLDNMLYDLRLLYVQVSQRPAGASKKG